MEETEFDEIRRTIESLDVQTAKKGAAIQFMMRGGSPDETGVEANRLGFLRMGIVFLRAGLAPTKDDVRAAGAEAERLMTEGSEIRFMSFALEDELAPPELTSKRWLKDRLAMIGCALVAFLAGMLMIGGVLFWCGVSRAD